MGVVAGMASSKKVKRPFSKKTPSSFKKTKAAEASYSRSLQRVGHEVGRIIETFGVMNTTKLAAMNEALRRYAELLAPWAKMKAEAMLAQVDQQDVRAWRKATAEMGVTLREEVLTAPTGLTLQALMKEQVDLITSLPTKAAERVHKLAIEALSTSSRGSEIEAAIAKSGKVTAGRARTIARTEVARASSVLTEARAKHIGSEGYTWRTARDADVRDSHRKMEGKFVRWDSPPTLDGLTGHAGQLPNCRCFPEPEIPEDLLG